MIGSWPFPDGTKRSLARMGIAETRGQHDRAMTEYLIGVLVRGCPQYQRGDAVDRMIAMVDEFARIEAVDRDVAATEVCVAITPLFIRERPRDEIKTAAIGANAKWSRGDRTGGVLDDGELVTLVREQWLTHQHYSRRRRRCA